MSYVVVSGGETEEAMEDDVIAGEAAEEDAAAGEVEEPGLTLLHVLTHAHLSQCTHDLVLLHMLLNIDIILPDIACMHSFAAIPGKHHSYAETKPVCTVLLHTLFLHTFD